MKRSEKVAYMANVLSIASVDGKIVESEAKVLRHVARELGVNQEILDDAKRLIGSGTYRLRLPTMPVDRMSNVEDMVMVALADDEVKASEAAPIEKVAGILRLAQADVDMVVARARARLHKLRQKEAKAAARKKVADRLPQPDAPPPLPGKAAARPKPKPPPVPKRKAATPRARPVRRASPVEPQPVPKPETAKPEPAPEPPPAQDAPAPAWKAGPGITIAFTGGENELAACLELTLAAPESGEHVSRGATWYHAAWPLDKLQAAISLAMKVALLADRKAYVDGSERPWDEIFGFCACALARASSRHPVEYCFGNETVGINPCGCRLLAFDWAGSAEWLTRGTFENDHRYRFDKAALRKLLEEGLERVRFCPHLKPDLARAMLRALPDAIHAWGAWSYREATPESREVQTVSVRESVHGCDIRATKRVEGIAPTSARGAIRLIKAAARKCGLREPDYALLYRRGRQSLRR